MLHKIGPVDLLIRVYDMCVSYSLRLKNFSNREVVGRRSLDRHQQRSAMSWCFCRKLWFLSMLDS